MISNLKDLRQQLQDNSKKDFVPLFFKMAPGDYAEHDQFIGVTTPVLKKLAKTCTFLSFKDVKDLLNSSINEERMLALFILLERYQKDENKEFVYDFFIENLKFVNNWNLVDSAAPGIMGAHLFERDKNILLNLAKSENLWERRVAIVSTYYFIKQENFEWTLLIAEMLLNDSHDLIHKATGWMLREVGKRNQTLLEKFLDQHGQKMPRTMFRYAIERFSKELRLSYLRKHSKKI